MVNCFSFKKKTNKSHAQKQKGFTLIEVLVSVVILGLVGTALFALTITAVTGSGWASKRSMGMQYAKEGIEGVRSFRDQNGWPALSPLSGTYYLKRQSSGFTLTTNAADGNLGNGLTRTAVLSTVNSTQKKVKVDVSYTENGQPRSVTLVTYLTDWH